jgi:hypothetical protein
MLVGVFMSKDPRHGHMLRGRIMKSISVSLSPARLPSVVLRSCGIFMHFCLFLSSRSVDVHM